VVTRAALVVAALALSPAIARAEEPIVPDGAVAPDAHVLPDPVPRPVRIDIARPPPPPPIKPPPPRKKADPPMRSKLGLRMGFGAIPVERRRIHALGLGLAFEHQLAGRWRMFGEYEWLWLSDLDQRRREPTSHNGHRLHTGVRRVLADTTLKKVLRFYVDAELGGGIASMSLPRTVGREVAVLPHGFVGLRFGYTFLQPDNRASRAWEPEFLVRAMWVPDGVGITGGVGMAWD
jgi:hypothetical protein